jgi:hypothetical protein
MNLLETMAEEEMDSPDAVAERAREMADQTKHWMEKCAWGVMVISGKASSEFANPDGIVVS